MRGKYLSVRPTRDIRQDRIDDVGAGVSLRLNGVDVLGGVYPERTLVCPIECHVALLGLRARTPWR
jgi:hypothetical protein